MADALDEDHFIDLVDMLTRKKLPGLQEHLRFTGREKGGFVKGWFWRTCPRSGFRSGGTCECTVVPVFWFGGNIRMYPRSGFRSGGTSAKTTLLKNHPFSSESKCHLRVVTFRRVPPLHERKGIPLPTRSFRGALQKNDACFDLVLPCMGSLHKCHFRAGAKGGSEGTPRYTQNCLR